MRRVLSAKDFVTFVLKAAEVDYPYVICYSNTFPNMVDPEWREYVTARMAIEKQRGIFESFKFSPPDELDDDWQFVATLAHIPDSHLMVAQDYNPGPETWQDWLKLLALIIFVASGIGILIGGLILYFTGAFQ